MPIRPDLARRALYRPVTDFTALQEFPAPLHYSVLSMSFGTITQKRIERPRSTPYHASRDALRCDSENSIALESRWDDGWQHKGRGPDCFRSFASKGSKKNLVPCSTFNSFPFKATIDLILLECSRLFRLAPTENVYPRFSFPRT